MPPRSPISRLDAGKFKGDCKISYDDPYAAGSACDLFNGKDFSGTQRFQLAANVV